MATCHTAGARTGTGIFWLAVAGLVEQPVVKAPLEARASLVVDCGPTSVTAGSLKHSGLPLGSAAAVCGIPHCLFCPMASAVLSSVLPLLVGSAQPLMRRSILLRSASAATLGWLCATTHAPLNPPAVGLGCHSWPPLRHHSCAAQSSCGRPRLWLLHCVASAALVPVGGN